MELPNPSREPSTFAQFLLRLGIFVLFLAAVALIWLSNLYLTERFSQTMRLQAESRLSLYTGRITSDLQRISVVPLLLSRDTTLISALNSGDFVATSQRLISYKDEIGAKSIALLDKDGRVVASSERRDIGENKRNAPYFVDAVRSNETLFKTTGGTAELFRHYYARRLESARDLIGVIAVEIDVNQLFEAWSLTNTQIYLTNSEGIVIHATDRSALNKTLEESLRDDRDLSGVDWALRTTGEWAARGADMYVGGKPLFLLDSKVPFQGWRMVYLSSFEAVRARVNVYLALEIMGLAILAALAFYVLSRRAIRQSFLFQAESTELRNLNAKLSREIAERERVERDLHVAEQSLAQSSKLAALGEMSAAVSHELNQPLAAMRTYLAGAKLLLQRQRPDEALSSFQRIDDLIGRMGAITKQLKSYARKGGDDLVPIDFRSAVTESLAMMAPQLSQQSVEITTTLPDEPIMVLGDIVRLEQVIVNLFRNALDAMKEVEDPTLDIMLVAGETARLSVRDNGTGLDNLEEMFEPFYTTKKPGEGVGLGLAISSGIAKDLGGRLTARNTDPHGAVFEFQLPLIQQKLEAAE